MAIPDAALDQTMNKLIIDKVSRDAIFRILNVSFRFHGCVGDKLDVVGAQPNHESQRVNGNQIGAWSRSHFRDAAFFGCPTVRFGQLRSNGPVIARPTKLHEADIICSGPASRICPLCERGSCRPGMPALCPFQKFTMVVT